MRKVRQLKLKKTRGTFEIETFQERESLAKALGASGLCMKEK